MILKKLKESEETIFYREGKSDGEHGEQKSILPTFPRSSYGGGKVMRLFPRPSIITVVRTTVKSLLFAISHFSSPFLCSNTGFLLMKQHTIIY